MRAFDGLEASLPFVGWLGCRSQSLQKRAEGFRIHTVEVHPNPKP